MDIIVFKKYSYVLATAMLTNLFIGSASEAMEMDIVFDDSIFLTQHCINYRKIIGADVPYDKCGEGVKIAVIENRYFDPEGDTKSALTQKTKDRLSQNNPERNQADGHINCVASIIAGTNGIVPQSQLEIIHYERDPNNNESLVTAIRQAIDAKVDFINMSIGFGSIGCDFPQELHQPLLEARNAGIGIMLAAGNEYHLRSGGVTLGSSMYKGFGAFLEEMQGHMKIVVSTSYKESEGADKNVKYNLRLLSPNPSSELLSLIKPGELGLFCEENSLYCKIHNKEKMQIVKEEITSFWHPLGGEESFISKEGLDSEVFSRVLYALQVPTNSTNFQAGFAQENNEALLQYACSKNYTAKKVIEEKSYFSNCVNDKIAKYTIAAPGETIRTYGINSAPEIMSGTSFATPMVVAAAALLKSNFPLLKNMETLDILAKSARKKNPTYNFGQGIIDIPAAFKLAATYNFPADSEK